VCLERLETSCVFLLVAHERFNDAPTVYQDELGEIELSVKMRISPS